MAQRQTKLKKHIKSKSSPKTAKRLAVKLEMLRVKALKPSKRVKTTA
jgi:hypothetical protein